MRHIDKIIIHCSSTPQGRHVTVGQIDSWHRQRGFRSIGYHYVVYLDGSVHKGRKESEIGAHCSGCNANSIGVCYIGGLAADGKTPADTRTDSQKDALSRLVAELKSRYPSATVHGHNQLTCTRLRHSPGFNPQTCVQNCVACRYSAKACPSFDVKAEFGSGPA